MGSAVKSQESKDASSTRAKARWTSSTSAATTAPGFSITSWNWPTRRKIRKKPEIRMPKQTPRRISFTGKDRLDFPELPADWRTRSDFDQLLEFNEILIVNSLVELDEAGQAKQGSRRAGVRRTA